MNNNAWIIWNELVKTDYKILYITIYMNYVPNYNLSNSLEIEIEFFNYDMIEKFKKEIFKQYGIDINDNYSKFKLELKNLNTTHHATNNILSHLAFPPNVENIEIIEITTKNIKIHLLKNKTIELHNLPKNLSQLKLSSLNFSFDLSNLPLGLFLLEISECEQKINLDYLPGGLKILYLPPAPLFKNVTYDYYDLIDLSNLPLSLIEIHFGYIVFSSIGSLMKSFDEKIKYGNK